MQTAHSLHHGCMVGRNRLVYGKRAPMRPDTKRKASLAWGLLLTNLALWPVCLAMMAYGYDLEARRCRVEGDYFPELFWGSILVLLIIGLPFAFAAVTVGRSPGVWPWFSLSVALLFTAPSVTLALLGLLSVATCAA
jgi:hypothetical protein